ncbi:MAG: DUF6599 family protein [Candidatus Poribacteria bacterium]
MLKKQLLMLCCFVIILFIYGCSEENADNNSILSPIALLPTDNEISGWTTLGAYEEADDYDSLYAIIDGGAQVFIDNGFVSGAFQEYISSISEIGGAGVVVRIYDQGSEENAKTVYDKTSTGITIPWNGAGKEARIDQSALASYIIEFYQRNFFVQVYIQQKTDEALNIAKLFASHISKKIR